MTVIFLGPPGAGKGTQATDVVETRGLVHVATGNLFRALDFETDLGREVKAHMDGGGLVPDDVVLKMVDEHLRSDAVGDKTVLFDGFPRTVAQAQGLDRLLGELGRTLSGVVYFQIDDEVVVSRLSGRRTCAACGTPFHVDSKPPKVEGVCDTCGSTDLVQRDDDQPETVRKRLATYHEQTAPLIDYYESRGLLRRIDADGDIEAIGRQTLAIVDESLAARPS